MTFPTIQVIYKLNFYVFPFLVVSSLQRTGFIYRYVSFIQVASFAFAIGSLLSALNSSDFNASFSVVLNFMYWGLMIAFFLAHGRTMNPQTIIKGLVHGLGLSLLYYFVLQKTPITSLPFLGKLPQNAIAFLLICFSPLTIFYLKKMYGKKWAFIAAVSLVLLSFLTGSRSGSILVMFGVFGSYFIEKLSLRRGLPTLVFLLISIVFLEVSQISPAIIKSLNKEAYDLIYNPNEVFNSDVSYLSRVALREKGLKIFEENKTFGSGLNTFTKTEVIIEGKAEWKNVFNYKELEKGVGTHNSYLNILAEGGLVCFIPFVTILLLMLWKLFTQYSKLSQMSKTAMIGVITMCIHFFFVAAILNVFAWFNIAIAASLLTFDRKNIHVYP